MRGNRQPAMPCNSPARLRSVGGLVASLALSAALLWSHPVAAQEPAGEGTLVVAKEVTGGAGPDVGIFTFSGSWGESFPLSAGQQKATLLPAGTYTVSESPEPGYIARGASCAGPTGTETFPAPSATVSLGSGQATTCTFKSDPIVDIGIQPEVTANARLGAIRSCRGHRKLVALVTAGSATRVSFTLNGRWFATGRRPYRGRTFRATTRTGPGPLELSARVTFTRGSSPPELRLTRRIAACPSGPAFAGGSRR